MKVAEELAQGVFGVMAEVMAATFLSLRSSKEWNSPISTYTSGIYGALYVVTGL